jgi:hypothetical protein
MDRPMEQVQQWGCRIQIHGKTAGFQDPMLFREGFVKIEDVPQDVP